MCSKMYPKVIFINIPEVRHREYCYCNVIINICTTILCLQYYYYHFMFTMYWLLILLCESPFVEGCTSCHKIAISYFSVRMKHITANRELIMNQNICDT